MNDRYMYAGWHNGNGFICVVFDAQQDAGDKNGVAQ